MTSVTNEVARKFISLAESMFGAMTSEWKYRGVEFNDSPPHLAYYRVRAEVAISLSLKALDDELQRNFQLAHEVCHLLYPTADVETATVPRTIVINEGVSTYFSIYILNSTHGCESGDLALNSLASNSQKLLFSL